MEIPNGFDFKSIEQALHDHARKNVFELFALFNTKSPVKKVAKTKNLCESPTALLRRRELQKLTATETRSESPTSSVKSSKSSRSSTVPFENILRNVVAYVEIRSNGSDRSAGAKALLKSMGATVREKFTTDVTHVIFKDGSYDTYNRAKLFKVHFVSVLWLEASRRSNVREAEKNYPALGTKNYDHNVSLICSQMQKDYEDVIRSEIRRSLKSGTSLPSTKFLIESKSSSFQNDGLDNIMNKIRGLSPVSSPDSRNLDLGNVSPLSSSSSEASSIILETSKKILAGRKSRISEINDSLLPMQSCNDRSDRNMEITCLSDTDSEDCRSLISGRRILRNSTNMELTRLETPLKHPDNKRKFLKENSSDDEFYKLRTPKRQSGIFTKPSRPKNLTTKRRSTRKTIETSNNDDSSTDLSSSNMSLEKSGEIYRSRSSDEKKLSVDTSKISRTSSNMSLLRLSSDRENTDVNVLRNNESTSNVLRKRENRSRSSNMLLQEERLSIDAPKNSRTSSNMSSLRLSSEKGAKNRGKSSDMSPLRLSSDREKSGVNASRNSKSSSNLSLLEQQGNDGKNSTKSSNMSSLRLSSDKEKSLADASRNSKTSSKMSSLRLTLENGGKSFSKSSEMSSLRLSSDVKRNGDTSLNMLEKHENCLEINKSSNMSSENIRITRSKSSFSNDKDNMVFVSKNSKTSSNMSLEKQQNHGKSANILEKSNEEENSSESFVTAEEGIENDDEFSDLPNDLKDNDVPPVKRTRNSLRISNNTRKNNEESIFVNKKPRKPLKCVVEIEQVNKGQQTELRESGEENGECEKESRDLRNVIIQGNVEIVPPTIKPAPRKTRGQTMSQKDSPVENVRPRLSRSKSESRIETRNIVSRRRKLFDPNDNLETNLIQDDDEEREKIRKGKTLKLTQKTDGIFQTGNVLLSQKAVEWLEKNNEKGKEKLNKIITPPKSNRDVSIITKSSDRQSQLIREFVHKKTTQKEKDELSTPRTRKTTQKAQTDVCKKRRSTLDFQNMSNLPRIRAKIQYNKNPTIVCTKFHNPDVQVFASIVKKLGGFEVENEVSSRTTHLVVGEPLRTINMLRALARGIWILKKEWLFASLENGKWLPEENYEVVEFSPAVQRCRLERMILGPQYTQNIFLGLGRIYIAPSTTPRCSDLRELVVLCEGKITKNQNLANISVGTKIEGCQCVNEYWILDSILRGKLKSMKKYPIK